MVTLSLFSVLLHLHLVPRGAHSESERISKAWLVTSMLHLNSYKLLWYLQGHFLLANFDNHAAADAVQSSEEGQSPESPRFTAFQVCSCFLVK